MKNNLDKRNRLIQSAIKLFYQKGVGAATLADIATAADVPLGNVYYYFKLKSQIINAVIKHHSNLLQQFLWALDSKTQNPKERLKTLLDQTLSEQETIINFGNPLGGLCMDLGRMEGEFYKPMAELMQELIFWCENQFKNINHSSNSKQLATHYISSIQGICMLTVGIKNPALLKEEKAFLVHWLDSCS